VSYGDLIHPEDRDELYAGVQAAISERVAFRLTYRIVAADGYVKWVWGARQRGVFGVG
jgi:hypothetical protein